MLVNNSSVVESGCCMIFSKCKLCSVLTSSRKLLCWCYTGCVAGLRMYIITCVCVTNLKCKLIVIFDVVCDQSFQVAICRTEWEEGEERDRHDPETVWVSAVIRGLDPNQFLPPNPKTSEYNDLFIWVVLCECCDCRVIPIADKQARNWLYFLYIEFLNRYFAMWDFILPHSAVIGSDVTAHVFASRPRTCARAFKCWVRLYCACVKMATRWVGVCWVY